MEKILWQPGYLPAANLFKFLLCELILAGVLPVVVARENVESSDGRAVVSMAAVQEISHPTAPALVELLKHLPSLSVFAQGVIYRVQGHQFQVFKGPVIRN